MSFIIYVALVLFLMYKLKPILDSLYNDTFLIRSFGDTMTFIVVSISSFIVGLMSYYGFSSIISSSFVSVTLFVGFLIFMFFVRENIIKMFASNNTELDDISWLRNTKVDYSISFEENLKNRHLLDTLFFVFVLWPVVFILYVYTKIHHKF